MTSHPNFLSHLLSLVNDTIAVQRKSANRSLHSSRHLQTRTSNWHRSSCSILFVHFTFILFLFFILTNRPFWENNISVWKGYISRMIWENKNHSMSLSCGSWNGFARTVIVHVSPGLPKIYTMLNRLDQERWWMTCSSLRLRKLHRRSGGPACVFPPQTLTLMTPALESIMGPHGTRFQGREELHGLWYLLRYRIYEGR